MPLFLQYKAGVIKFTYKKIITDDIINSSNIIASIHATTGLARNFCLFYHLLAVLMTHTRRPVKQVWYTVRPRIDKTSLVTQEQIFWNFINYYGFTAKY